MSQPRIVNSRLPEQTRELMYRMAELDPEPLAKLRTALHQGDKDTTEALLGTRDTARAALAFKTLTGAKP